MEIYWNILRIIWVFFRFLWNFVCAVMSLSCNTMNNSKWKARFLMHNNRNLQLVHIPKTLFDLQELRRNSQKTSLFDQRCVAERFSNKIIFLKAFSSSERFNLSNSKLKSSYSAGSDDVPSHFLKTVFNSHILWTKSVSRSIKENHTSICL